LGSIPRLANSAATSAWISDSLFLPIITICIDPAGLWIMSGITGTLQPRRWMCRPSGPNNFAPANWKCFQQHTANRSFWA
jgi:hypothetical protein